MRQTWTIMPPLELCADCEHKFGDRPWCNKREAVIIGPYAGESPVGCPAFSPRIPTLAALVSAALVADPATLSGQICLPSAESGVSAPSIEINNASK